MPIFQISKSRLKKINLKSLPKEKDLQTLIEHNLREVLDVDFLASEYATTFGGRIDTLGIDQSGSPVIIEYKRTSEENVINQGLSYLRWLLDHKAEFELLVSGELKSKRKIDWTQPRVICIAESYTKFDLDTADILPIKIELLKYKIYENDTLLLEAEKYAKVVLKISKKKVKPLQKEYPLEYHLSKCLDDTKKLFYKLREEILSLSNEVREKSTRYYVGYWTNQLFADVHLHKTKMRIGIKVKRIKDVKKMTKKIPESYGWAKNYRRFTIDSVNQINNAIDLIKQSYKETL